mmetsp:Transcript_130400/g.225452  ORF Transcript_130400/g.225452 Transcript_130400/m.225452 type:complete len:93 (+) Transcript_130400:759-1037(+)
MGPTWVTCFYTPHWKENPTRLCGSRTARSSRLHRTEGCTIATDCRLQEVLGQLPTKMPVCVDKKGLLDTAQSSKTKKSLVILLRIIVTVADN